MDNPFQGIGSKSNSHVGREFELIAQRIFAIQRDVHLRLSHPVEVGIGSVKKRHNFDLGCDDQKWLVECKSHRWTSGNNVPVAKMTTWNEAMYYFLAAPDYYRKVLFVLKDLRHSNGESLASFYARTYGHLIPQSVEIWEYDEATDTATRVT